MSAYGAGTFGVNLLMNDRGDLSRNIGIETRRVVNGIDVKTLSRFGMKVREP